MEKSSKKSCCGCFGSVFSKRERNSKVVDGFSQTLTNPFSGSKVLPELKINAKSETKFLNRKQSFELPGIAGLKNTIITGNNHSFSSNKSDRCIHTPIFHNYSPDTQLRESPLPTIFEHLEKKRDSSKPLPFLSPATPGTTFKIRSQTVRT